VPLSVADFRQFRGQWHQHVKSGAINPAK